MLRINRKVEYALMALKFMAHKADGAITSAREVCDHFQTPFDTTAKVMQLMNSHNILESVKGIKGGYLIKGDLEQISYKDLTEIIEGRPFDNICESHKGTCELYQTCNIIGPAQRLNSKINLLLAKTSLKELLADEGETAPHHNDGPIHSSSRRQS